MNISDIKKPADLRAASSLKLCYSDEELAACLPLTLDVLLHVPAADACWAIAGILPVNKRLEWAEASARRAKEYAGNSSAADAVARASASAADAARAAAYASRAAYAAARAAVEAAVANAYAASRASRAASRAAAYAAAAADDDAAYYAARAIRHGATAAAYAVARADTEYRIAIRHGAMLLGLGA